jgi:hypothetical protein
LGIDGFPRGRAEILMLRILALVTVMAIVLTIPIIAAAIEESGPQRGEDSYHKRGADHHRSRLMQQNDGYGLGDFGKPELNYVGGGTGQEGYGNHP